MEPCLTEELSVEKDGSRQMGVILYQRSEFGANEPANLGVGEAFSHRTKGRQGLDYITEGAGLYNQNILQSIGHLNSVHRILSFTLRFMRKESLAAIVSDVTG